MQIELRNRIATTAVTLSKLRPSLLVVGKNQLLIADDLSDSEEPVPTSPKRLKKANQTSNRCDVVDTVICDVDKDEEDWLLPPPKTVNGERRIAQEDSTIKELRQQMGNELQVQLHMYTLMVFILLCSMTLRCSSDVDHSNDLDSTVSLQCSRRYLSKLYFENHDSLIDTDFQDFWAHELPVCSCNALPQNLDYAPRLSVLWRQLNGEGSHRHLSTFIKFYIQPEGMYELPAHLCQVIVVEKLPSGVFADPFELQHLVQRGVLIDAAVFGDTNLELPSALSNRSVVEVHMDFGQNIFLVNERTLEIKFDLPLHARYPPLSRSGYAVVEMGVPDIFMRYITREKPQASNCVSITRVEIADTNTTPVLWRVPSGNKEHSGLVSAATFTSALLSTLFIVISAIYSSNAHFSYRTKQS